MAGQHSQISAISRETSQYAFFVRTHQAAEGNIVPWRNGLHGKNLAQSETLCTWGSSLHGTWEDGSKTEMSGLARHAVLPSGADIISLPRHVRCQQQTYFRTQ